MTRMATTYLHEDVEDLLNYGSTYHEIIERSGFSNWDAMHKSFKRRGRQDLIDAMREKKAKV
jgi:AraC-like DNA-binding protein